jgi:endonuclease-3 related protein
METESESDARTRVLEIYQRLVRHFGPRHWWPGDTPFEVMIGAILTQNTAWTNVEKAIGNLKSAGALGPDVLFKMDLRRLKRMIRPTGYYNEKAKKLKNYLRFYCASPICASPLRMARVPLSDLRERLLNIKGIGPETADSILLYALSKPVFVVDAYTRRIFYRLGLTSEKASYDELQGFFMRNLPEDIKLYNDYHAQIVALGKEYCRRKPGCGFCPLDEICMKKGVSP